MRLIECHYCEGELHDWEERSSLVCHECYDHHQRVVMQYESWKKRHNDVRQSKQTPAQAVVDGLTYDRV